MCNSAEDILQKPCQVWLDKISFEGGVDVMSKLVQNINCFTSIVKLRDFQYRLLHNKVFLKRRISSLEKKVESSKMLVL